MQQVISAPVGIYFGQLGPYVDVMARTVAQTQSNWVNCSTCFVTFFKMTARLVIGSVTLALLNIGCGLIGHVEAGCLDCVKQSPANGADSPIRPRPAPDNEWSEAFRKIDKHLRSHVQTANLDANLRAVKELLLIEQGRVPLDSNGRPSKLKRISQQISSKKEDVARTALQKLYNINSVTEIGMECGAPTMMDLKDINGMALDPIGRRIGNVPDRFGRVDELVFTAALQRAETCLLRYKSLLLKMSMKDDDEHLGMLQFLDGLFERKMREARFGGLLDLDVIFRKRSNDALDFVKRMNISIRDDLNVENFREKVINPCKEYVKALTNTFDSMDFDLKLRRFIPYPLMETFDGYNLVINRQRAYYLTCSKFIYL